MDSTGSVPYSYDMVANVKENTYGNYVDASATAELFDETTHNAKSYAPGVVGHYVVDFHPNAEPDATSATSVSTGIAGVYGMEVQEGTQMYRLIHNTTSSPVTYTAALSASTWGTSSVTVHHAYTPQVNGSTTSPIIPTVPEVPGETYRSSWMDLKGNDSYSSTLPTNVSLAGGTVSFTVPANSHILLTNYEGNLPASWLNQDIGNVGLPGSTSYNNGTFTLVGSGADIWNSADAFQYAFQGLTGDGAIVSRVATQPSTNKTGVMIRETLSDDSRYVDMVLNSEPGQVRV